MPRATCLRDLLRIRAKNRKVIERVNKNLGSALGFKRKTGADGVSDEPAVLIFVPEKIENHWLAKKQKIPKILEGPDGLTCPTDVVVGATYDDFYLKLYGSDGWSVGHGPDSLISGLELRGEAPISEENVKLLEKLHGWTRKMTPGSRLVGADAEGYEYTGTLGCFVKERRTGKLGILTNHHVADREGNVLEFPFLGGRDVGIVKRLYEDVSDEDRFPGVVDEPREYYVVDCAFVALKPAIVRDIDPKLPSIGKIGPPLPLDLDTMGPVGRRVTSVGQRRGKQSGRIVAFSYEYEDGRRSYHTDYLIIGDEAVDKVGRQVYRTAFSDPGDSGKVIVTDDRKHMVSSFSIWTY